MCGITGKACFRGGWLPAEEAGNVERVLDIMKKRGPDGRGIACGKNWIFGHVRLAILDPSSGAQPFCHEDTGTVLSYNGEIYNFRQLREELKAGGYVFKTDCDTETVMASYLEWGEECIDRFNGFFSFAVADPARNIIFAARDRIGIKPFYYTKNEDCFFFASTVPALRALSHISPEPDIEAVSNYLTTGKVLFGDKTLVKGIYSLRPGHKMKVDLNTGRLSVNRYWRRPVLSPAEKRASAVGFSEARAETRSLLEDSVRKRLISDVPLGAFLSGGLDSAIISTCATKYSRLPVPFFCAGTDREEANEYEYARMMADRTGSELFSVSVSSGRFAEDWDFLVGEKGLPLSTPNEISIYGLSAALREKCTVTLTGEGADEIFGGYSQPHFSAYDFDRCARTPETADTDSAFGMAMLMMYGRSFFINDTDHYTATCCWMPYAIKERLFKDNVWDSLEQDNALFLFYEDFFNSLSKCSSLDKRLHLHAEFNLENLLNRIDNSSMSASVEARVPFNDHRIVEFAFRMPDEYKIDWTSAQAAQKGAELPAAEIDRLGLIETKKLPRRAFSAFLPDEIIKRRKMSFPVPFRDWFSGPLAGEIKELCLDSDFSRDFFDKKTVSAMLEKHDRNLWLTANLCKWWDVLNSVIV